MRIIPVVLLLSLVAAVATAERPSQLEVVLDRHRAAVMQDPSNTVIESLQVDLIIEEPSFTVTARYHADRDGRMRIDVFDDDTRVFSEGLSADGAWQWHGGEANLAPVSDAGRAALERGIANNLYALHERPALGYRLRYDGMAATDSGRYWKIRSRAPDGFEEVFYIDTDSALIAEKREVKALHPDQGARERASVTYFRDYRERGGRQFPFRAETRAAADGSLLQAVTVTDIEVNAGNLPVSPPKLPMASR